MAELVAHLLVRTLKDLQHVPLSRGDELVAQAPLPLPMIAGNHHSQLDRWARQARLLL